jgi:threonine/homoserine/homoserine lactone efflux protein
MPSEQMIAFLIFAVVAAITPGPSNVMVTAAGANLGILRGLPCLLGVAAGMGLMMFLVPLGLGSLVLTYPLLLRALNWCGAAFLLWLAWKIATASQIVSATAGSPVGFVRAAIFQWVNPKSWLVSVSAAGTFLDVEAGSPVVQAALLGGLFFCAALVSCSAWLVFGAAIQRLLTSERRLRTFNITMGALLALSVVLIVR